MTNLKQSKEKRIQLKKKQLCLGRGYNRHNMHDFHTLLLPTRGPDRQTDRQTDTRVVVQNQLNQL